MSDAEKQTEQDDAQSSVRLQPFGQGPRFSVLMCAYNRSDLIGVAIDSVLEQDFSDYELVIVDDGSTDATPEVVRGYDDPRIRFIRKDLNEGRPITRNRAIEEARGEFVLWMADDDLLMPGLLTTYDHILKTEPHIDVVYGNLQLFDHETGEDLNVFEPNDWTGRDEALVGAKLQGSCVPDGGTATRRTLYTKVGPGPYDSEFARAQDYEFWSRLVGQASFRKVDQVVYRYRKHLGGNSWGRFIDLSFDSKIIRRHLARHPLPRLFPKLDWGAEKNTATLALFRVARILEQYGDHHNGARIVSSIAGYHHDPDMAECMVRFQVGLGALEAAEATKTRFESAMPGAHLATRRMHTLIVSARNFRREVESAGENYAHLLALCEAWRKQFEVTHEVAEAEAKGHLGQGRGMEALQNLVLAVRLNPNRDSTVQDSMKLRAELGETGPRTDAESIQRRMLETHNEFAISQIDVNGPLVSVIVIPEAGYDLESACGWVRAQDYTNIEIVMAEPDSTGSWSGHQRAYEKVTGEFVAWMNAGTCWYPDHISRLVGLLHEGIALAWSDGHGYRHRDDGIIEKSDWRVPQAVKRDHILAENLIPLDAIVHRKQDGEGSKFSQCLHGDWHFILSLSDAGQMARTTTPTWGRSSEVPAPNTSMRSLFELYGCRSLETMTNMTVRDGQNAQLSALGAAQPRHGRVNIVLFGAEGFEAVGSYIDHINHRTLVPHDVVILLAGHDSGSAAQFEVMRNEREGLRVVWNQTDVTAAKLTNQGLAKSNGEYVVFLQAGLTLSEGWLARMVWCAMGDPRNGMVVPASDEGARTDTDELQTVDPRCLLLSRGLLDRVGGMDLALNAPGCEIHDLVVRGRIGGYRALRFNDVVVSGPETGQDITESSAQKFMERWGFEPGAETVAALPFEYDRDLHFKAFGAEEGFRPDARPVLVEEARERNILISAPWDDTQVMDRLLSDLKGLPAHICAWLRVPPGSADAQITQLRAAVERMGLTEANLPSILVLDPQLAREREAGLYVAADAVYVDDAWPDSEITSRRGADCGRTVLRGAQALSAWAQQSD